MNAVSAAFGAAIADTIADTGDDTIADTGDDTIADTGDGVSDDAIGCATNGDRVRAGHGEQGGDGRT